MSDLLSAVRSLRQAAEAARASLERSYGAIDAAGVARRAYAVLEALRADPILWAEVQRRLTYWHRAGADLARRFDDGQSPDGWPEGTLWPPRPRSAAEWRNVLEYIDMARRLGADDPDGLRAWGDEIQRALDKADGLGVEGLTWIADPDLERDLGERLLAPEIIGRLLELVGVIESGRLAVAVAEPAGAGGETGKPKGGAKGKRGRPKVQPTTADAKPVIPDAKLAECWKGGWGNYASKKELAQSFGMKYDDVVRALDRHRKQLKAAKRKK